MLPIYRPSARVLHSNLNFFDNYCFYLHFCLIYIVIAYRCTIMQPTFIVVLCARLEEQANKFVGKYDSTISLTYFLAYLLSRSSRVGDIGVLTVDYSAEILASYRLDYQ